MNISIQVAENGFIFQQSKDIHCVSGNWVFETPEGLAKHVEKWAKGEVKTSDVAVGPSSSLDNFRFRK